MIRINRNLLDRLKRYIAEKYGYIRKGMISREVEKAIEFWISKQDDIEYLKSKVRELEERIERLERGGSIRDTVLRIIEGEGGSIPMSELCERVCRATGLDIDTVRDIIMRLYYDNVVKLEMEGDRLVVRSSK